MRGVTDSASTRPRQVTLAGWMIVVGSAVVVFSAFERVAGLHSLETQEAVRDFLAEPPGDGLGLSVDEALGVIRGLSLVAGGCATAAAILGFYALRRSTGARLALTILAFPLLLAGLAVGGLVSSLVVAASVMLWVSPAREWFRGERPAASRPAGTAGRATDRPDPFAAPPSAPSSPSTSGVPVQDRTEGPAAEHALVQGAAWRPPARIPGAVIAACVVTWAFTALIGLLLGLTALVLASSPDMLFDEVQRQNPELLEQGVSRDDIRLASLVTAGIVVPWCLAAAVFAVFVIRRARWARTALLVSSAVSGALSLLAMFGSSVTVVPFIASVITFALLSRADTKAWFAASRPTGAVEGRSGHR